MKEKFVLLKTAKLAKEKGFDQNPYKAQENNCMAYYPEYTDGKGSISLNNPLYNLEHAIAMAPTQHFLNKFIREDIGIHLTIERNASGWYWAMCKSDGGTSLGYSDFSGPNDSGVWDDYDDAFENGLQVALNLKLRKYGHWSNFAASAIKEFKKNKDEI